jgi:hypothetical protein
MPTYIFLINVKCNSEFKYFITNNDHFKIKTIFKEKLGFGMIFL